MKKVNQIFILLILAFLVGGCNTSKSEGNIYNIMDYGASGDGKSDDASAIQKAIDKCSENGGGIVLVPAGHTFLCGPIHLASFVNLQLEPNSRLLANPDEKIYKESAFKENEGEGMMWISGKDLKNISITGRGEIDGNGVAFMGKELSDSYELKPITDFDPRPHVITLINCQNITVKDVTLKQGAYWTLHLIGCYDANIDGINILNNLKIRNGDGIDVDHSKKVRISNCFIESGDDCICLKNRREYQDLGPCENILVTNCTMTSRSCAIKIGSENMDRISHVVVNNCIIRDSNRGIGIQNRDEGTVENIIFSNIEVACHLFSNVWWGKAEPIYVTAYTRKAGDHKDAGWRFPKGMADYEVGTVTDISFNNIKCESENGVFLSAESKDKIQNIYFDEVDLMICKRTNYEGGIYDKRPSKGDDFVKGKTYGFYLDNASNVNIRNSTVRWGDNRSSYFADTMFSQTIDG